MPNINRYAREIELLVQSGSHWTADQIYRKLKKDHIFLGIGTVYKNLNLLVEQGIIMKTSGILDKIIYETAKPIHGHIVCHHSGEIIDVDTSSLGIANNLIPDNFKLQSINIIFDGYFVEEDGSVCKGTTQISHEQK